MERDSGPSPVCYFKPDFGERFCAWFGLDTIFLAIAHNLLSIDPPWSILSAYCVFEWNGCNRVPDFQLLRPYGFCLKRLRWLHRDQSEDFHRVILQYVAERSGLFIKWPPSLDTDGFRERKLYPVNVVPIPDRLEDSIAETKEENVLHRLFAEIVIDPKYLILRKDRVHIVIEFLGRCEIRSEWLLDHDPDPVASLFSR